MGATPTTGIRPPRDFGIGTTLLAAGYSEEALPYLERCDRSDPNALLNLGVCYRHLNLFDQAEDSLVDSIRIRKSSAAYTNLGSLYEDLGEFRAALGLHEVAWSMDKSPQIAFNYAMCLIREGRFQEAWPLWEYGRSLNDPRYPNIRRLTRADINKGIDGGRILVCSEGGYGDVFMYLRWFESLKDLGAKITFMVWDSVIPLLAIHPWIDGLVPHSEGISLFDDNDKLRFDWMTPLMSLPAILGVTEFSSARSLWIVSHVNDLTGICWKAEENTVARKHRSIPDSVAIRIADGCSDVVSLVPNESVPGSKTAKLQVSNWLETAKAIARCKRVITVDTAVAHLAGTLGEETWILLPKRIDPKWGTKEAPHFLYPNVRYFYQDDPVSWEGLGWKVREALHG